VIQIFVVLSGASARNSIHCAGIIIMGWVWGSWIGSPVRACLVGFTHRFARLLSGRVVATQVGYVECIGTLGEEEDGGQQEGCSALQAGTVGGHHNVVSRVGLLVLHGC
jgi:hypothetical protein